MRARTVALLAVFAGTAIPSSVKADRLLWWSKLGSEAEVLNPERGMAPIIDGRVNFVPGFFGNAYAAVGHSYIHDRIIIPENGLQFSPQAGTVEAWIMYPQDPIVSAYNYSMFGLVDGAYQHTDPTIRNQVRYLIGDGASEELYMLNVKLRFGSEVYVEAAGMDQVFHPGEWHHMGIVWDKDGIGGTSDCLQVYIDGAIACATSDNNWGSTPDVGNRHTIGKGEGFNDGTPAFAIDNIKIWDEAVTDGFSHRFDENYTGALMQTISATVLDTEFVPTGGLHGKGVLALDDTTTITIETDTGTDTYVDGEFCLSASLLSDMSQGGVAEGVFDGGGFELRDPKSGVLLSGDVVSLSLKETEIDGQSLLSSAGEFLVTGGSLADQFGQPAGTIAQLTFDLGPGNIGGFASAWGGLSNVTLSPVPEPTTLGLIGLGGIGMLIGRRYG